MRAGVASVVLVLAVAVGSVVASMASGTSPQLGLDLQGGASVVLQPKTKVPERPDAVRTDDPVPDGRGFSRTYRTILAADVASFLGAVVLYVLTVGSVGGFASFLALTALLDLCIAYFFTRPLVLLLGRNRPFTEARCPGVARGLAAAPADRGALT